MISSLFNQERINQELFGIKFNGHLSGEDYLIELIHSEISNQGKYPSYGRALRVEALYPDENIGWVVESKKKGVTRHPGIIDRKYGLGKVVFFAFDLGLSSEKSALFLDLLTHSLDHIHPVSETHTFYPGQLVPIEIKLKSLDGFYDLRISETYPEEILLYCPATDQWIVDHPWEIDVRLDADEMNTLLYYALAPDKIGRFTFHTEVGCMDNGVYQFYQGMITDILTVKDTATMADEIITLLSSLSVSGQEDAKVKNAVRYINDVRTRVIAGEKDIEKNIGDMLKAIDSLISITSAEIPDIRLMMDHLLRFWEGRWYFYR
ncbi:MAG: hypothetical protein A2169_09350 [Deltaproteobacteria bacterium RBG_13_47_9]|nr:MAG: hypothetical protein A2169_09350 [Deltaproteobacteria bacterium RBG_13_47_9]